MVERLVEAQEVQVRFLPITCEFQVASFEFQEDYFLSTAPHKRGSEYHAASFNSHLAMILATDLVVQLKGWAC